MDLAERGTASLSSAPEFQPQQCQPQAQPEASGPPAALGTPQIKAQIQPQPSPGPQADQTLATSFAADTTTTEMVADTEISFQHQLGEPEAKVKKEKKKRKKKKRLPHKSKMVTGYIIYASEIRKDIIKQYPNREFGDISKIVGVEWKNLPQETKIAYEKRAQEQNAKSKIAAAEALELISQANFCQQTNNRQTLYYDPSQSSPLPHVQQKDLTQSPIIQQQQASKLQVQAVVTKPIMQPQELQQQQQQQPFHIIQQQTQQTSQQQPVVTTVQYCANGAIKTPQQQQPQQANYYPSHTNNTPSQQLVNGSLNNSSNQYQRNNIIYKKPATVRLKPKDEITQTDPIVWVSTRPTKEPLRYSEKFLSYINNLL